jgi:general secretion pathway protein K
MSRPGFTDTERQRGFALLIVLWTLVLISFLVLHLTAAGRTEMRIAGNLAANAAARAAAEGAIYQAIFNLADPQPERRWALDGAAHELRVGRSRIALRLENEAARINPNFASPVLVEALLRVLGSDPERSAALATAIAQWVGQPTASRPPLSASINYPAGTPGYQPPGSPVESMDELAQVRGMDATLLATLRPHLTLLGPPIPDPNTADAAVAAALVLADRLAIGAAARPTAAAVVTVRIVAVAQGPGEALVTRAAVARIDPRAPDGYVVLAWTEGGA